MKTTISNRRISAVVLSACLMLCCTSAWALELVMVEQEICPYCKMFDREVGVDYDSTDIGQEVPLRRISLQADWPADLKRVRYDRLTPTFILVENGKEIGRLRGYPGKVIFWELLNQMIDKHKNTPD